MQKLLGLVFQIRKPLEDVVALLIENEHANQESEYDEYGDTCVHDLTSPAFACWRNSACAVFHLSSLQMKTPPLRGTRVAQF